MKADVKKIRPRKFPMSPPHGKHRHKTLRRSDLLSLICEMESNRRLQAATWQIESLRESLRMIDARRSNARRDAPLRAAAPDSHTVQFFGLL